MYCIILFIVHASHSIQILGFSASASLSSVLSLFRFAPAYPRSVSNTGGGGRYVSVPGSATPGHLLLGGGQHGSTPGSATPSTPRGGSSPQPRHRRRIPSRVEGPDPENTSPPAIGNRATHTSGLDGPFPPGSQINFAWRNSWEGSVGGKGNPAQESQQRALKSTNPTIAEGGSDTVGERVRTRV